MRKSCNNPQLREAAKGIPQSRKTKKMIKPKVRRIKKEV
jgi:hypothetical protein